MLVFLDESYEEDGLGGLRYAYAGFGIHELNYRKLAAAVHQCKLRYLMHDPGFTPEEGRAACETHMLVRSSCEDAELKAVDLLGSRQIRRHVASGSAPGVLLTGDLLECASDIGVTVFGTLWYPSDSSQAHDYAGPLPKRLHWLLERVERWMREEHPTQARSSSPTQSIRV